LYFNPSVSAYRDSLMSGINVVNKEVTVVDSMFLQQ